MHTSAPPLPDRVHANVARVLEEFRGREVVLLVNRGNRGDGVIHMGGRRLLATVGLQWHEIYQPEAPDTIRADVLLVFGNGAFCQTTHTMIETTQRLARHVRQVVILPASFDLACKPVREFAASWTERYTVFCREGASYHALHQAGVMPGQLVLSHDLAFSADLTAWAARRHEGRVGIFRRDKEIVYDRRPRGLPGYDASRGTNFEPEALLDYVAKFAEVHTDRTHAAISAAMMGRQVWFYRNCYFKNQAIYTHSLAHLPNVRFIGKQPFSLLQFASAMYWSHLRRFEMKGRSLLPQQRRRAS